MKTTAQTVTKVRESAPLVQAITNYVTINDCANILLAAGSSPAMCEAEEEAYAFSKLAAALYLNIGTLTREQAKAMKASVQGATETGAPVIVDPVGCAAIPRRIGFMNDLRATGDVSVVRGNLSEIKSLLGWETRARGVDSLDEGNDGIEVSKKLARHWKCIVAASGKTDVITDGDRTCLVENGSVMLTKITGAGCMLGALTAAYGAVGEDRLRSVAAAHLAFALAAEKAEKQDRGNLPGSFKGYLFDAMSQVTARDLEEEGNFSWK